MPPAGCRPRNPSAWIGTPNRAMNVPASVRKSAKWSNSWKESVPACVPMRGWRIERFSGCGRRGGRARAGSVSPPPPPPCFCSAWSACAVQVLAVNGALPLPGMEDQMALNKKMPRTYFGVIGGRVREEYDGMPPEGNIRGKNRLETTLSDLIVTDIDEASKAAARRRQNPDRRDPRNSSAGTLGGSGQGGGHRWFPTNGKTDEDVRRFYPDKAQASDAIRVRRRLRGTMGHSSAKK